MNRIDYELGFSGDAYSNAEGRGKAAICKWNCNGKHPANRSRRNACKSACDSKYLTSSESAPPPPVETAVEEVVTETRGGEENGENGGATGMSTGAKIGIGVGVLVLIGAIVLLARRK